MVNDGTGINEADGMTLVLNHDDVVRHAAEALAGCETLRVMMERVTAITNRKIAEQDGELDGDVLSVVDVVSSMVVETMLQVAAEDVEQGVETTIYVSAYGKSNEVGLVKLAEFFNLLTSELDAAIETIGDGDEQEAFMQWLGAGGEG